MRLTRAIRDQILHDVRADIPLKGYHEQLDKLIKADALSELPKELREAIAKNKDVLSYLETSAVWIKYTTVRVHNCHYELKDTVKDAALNIVELLKEEREAINNSLAELAVVLNNCSTTKKFIKVMPEMEKYIPKEEVPTENLPAAKTVTMLMNLGWPKDKGN